MLASELKIHRDTQALILTLMRYLDVVPRFIRFTLGERMVNKALDIMTLIRCANSDISKRREYLNMVYGNIEDIKSIARLFAEHKVSGRRVWDGKKCNNVAFQLDQIAKQAIAWRNSCRSQSSQRRE